MGTKSDMTVKSEYFNKAYRAPITIWGDVRIVTQLIDIYAKGARPG
jgi:hypothetical protein